MKLVLLARGGFNNPKLWSGTPHTLKQLFEKKETCEISTLNWQINRNVRRVYHIIYGKIFLNFGTARDPFLHRFCEQKINKTLKHLEDKPDWLLFISDYRITDKMLGKYKTAGYFDAFIFTWLEYMEDNRFGKKHFLRIYEKYNRIDLERMEVIFTQNEWTRQAIITHYSIAKEKIINVGFGVNLKPYQGEKNYNEEVLLIVLRKGTEKYKGLLLLLEAFQLLRKNRPQVKLAVVGTDVGADHPNVTCYYNQSREVTVKLFKKATLYVMPALHEPNGITYLEALANKAPIVGLNRFAVPEFSGYGEWGFMAQNDHPQELANVMEEALSNKERLREMGIKGQQFVMERYRWELVVDKMVQTMEQFVDSKNN